MRKFVVTIEGKSYEVGVEEVGVDTSIAPVVSPISAAPVAVAAPTPAAPVKAAVSTGGTKMEAPMPGLIVNLKVADGAKVEKDQPVIVLEAMKMENDLTAPTSGTIHFQVAKGSNVETGALLATID